MEIVIIRLSLLLTISNTLMESDKIVHNFE